MSRILHGRTVETDTKWPVIQNVRSVILFFFFVILSVSEGSAKVRGTNEKTQILRIRSE